MYVYRNRAVRSACSIHKCGQGRAAQCAASTAYVRKRREGQAPPLRFFTAPLPKEGRLFCNGSAGSASGGAAAEPHSLVSFHPAQGPVARREFRHPLQSPRAGNFAGPPRRGPRKRGPGARRLGAPERCSPEQAPGGSLVPFCPYRKGPAAGAAESLLYVYRNRAVRSACSIHKCGQGRAARVCRPYGVCEETAGGTSPSSTAFQSTFPEREKAKAGGPGVPPLQENGKTFGLRVGAEGIPKRTSFPNPAPGRAPLAHIFSKTGHKALQRSLEGFSLSKNGNFFRNFTEIFQRNPPL